MTGRLFGTDGVRGVAGRDLTARLATDLAAAAADVLGRQPDADPRRRAVVGRDTRSSGEFLEAAVTAGLAGCGVDVLRVGVAPTPAVAYLTAALEADFGVVLSASHNPARDNGIKFFARGGEKLSDAEESDIEGALHASGEPPATGFGRVVDATTELDRYLRHLLDSVAAGGTQARQAQPLAGLRVVVDCAHGAAYRLAPRSLRAAGADVVEIGVQPDGDNINAGCGATCLDALSAAVVAHEADAGLAHDGDADRCLAVDAAGAIVDGDQILAVLATELKAAGRLSGDTVVITVMSNLGLRHALAAAGIATVETPVGDKHIARALVAGGYVLGGEQSGHVILREHATTGDGLLTGLHLLAAVARRGVPLATAVAVMTRCPQVLVTVPGALPGTAAGPPSPIAAAVADAEAELGSAGRVVVRPSGTERAVRVMVESVDGEAAERVARRLVEAVRSALV